MCLEAITRRDETLAHLRTAAGLLELRASLAHFSGYVDAVLAGDATGPQFGLWALIVNGTPGGVGYSGRGAGPEEYASGGPVPSPGELLQRGMLALPPGPDPDHMTRVEALTSLALDKPERCGPFLWVEQGWWLSCVAGSVFMCACACVHLSVRVCVCGGVQVVGPSMHVNGRCVCVNVCVCVCL